MRRQFLAGFTASACKRYGKLDMHPLCRYLVNQLKAHQSGDLIILEELLTKVTVCSFSGLLKPWECPGSVLSLVPLCLLHMSCALLYRYVFCYNASLCFSFGDGGLHYYSENGDLLVAKRMFT